MVYLKYDRKLNYSGTLSECRTRLDHLVSQYGYRNNGNGKDEYKIALHTCENVCVGNNGDNPCCIPGKITEIGEVNKEEIEYLIKVLELEPEPTPEELEHLIKVLEL